MSADRIEPNRLAPLRALRGRESVLVFYRWWDFRAAEICLVQTIFERSDTGGGRYRANE